MGDFLQIDNSMACGPTSLLKITSKGPRCRLPTSLDTISFMCLMKPYIMKCSNQETWSKSLPSPYGDRLMVVDIKCIIDHPSMMWSCTGVLPCRTFGKCKCLMSNEERRYNCALLASTEIIESLQFGTPCPHVTKFPYYRWKATNCSGC